MTAIELGRVPLLRFFVGDFTTDTSFKTPDDEYSKKSLDDDFLNEASAVSSSCVGELFEIVVDKESQIVAENKDDLIEYLVTVRANTVELFAMRKRIDKTTPNSTYVITATVSDVSEMIEADELVPNSCENHPRSD